MGGLEYCAGCCLESTGYLEGGGVCCLKSVGGLDAAGGVFDCFCARGRCSFTCLDDESLEDPVGGFGLWFAAGPKVILALAMH